MMDLHIKVLWLILLLTPLGLSAQLRPDCKSMVAAGDQALVDSTYNEAILHYLSALNCNAQLGTELGPKIQKVFDLIEKQKEESNQRRVRAERLVDLFFNGSQNQVAWAYGPAGRFGVVDREGIIQGDGYNWELPTPFRDGISLAQRGGDFWMVNTQGKAISDGYYFLHPTDLGLFYGVKEVASNVSFSASDKKDKVIGIPISKEGKELTVRERFVANISQSDDLLLTPQEKPKFSPLNILGSLPNKPHNVSNSLKLSSGYWPISIVNKKGETLFLSGAKKEDINITQNLILAKKKEGETKKWGAFTIEGQQTLPYIYDSISYPWADKNYLLVHRDSLKGIFDSLATQSILPLKYTEIDWLDEANVIRTKQNNKYGIYQLSGKEVLPCQYNKIQSKSELTYEEQEGWDASWLKLVNGNMKGIYDCEIGELIIPLTEMEEIKPIYPNDYLWAVKKRYLWNLETTNGKKLLDSAYQEIRSLQDGWIYLKDRTESFAYYYPDKRLFSLGNSENVWSINERYLLSISKDRSIVYDSLGKEIWETKEFKLQPGGGEYVIAEKNGKYGIMSIFGDIVIPFKYSSIDHIGATYYLVEATFTPSPDSSVDSNAYHAIIDHRDSVIYPIQEYADSIDIHLWGRVIKIERDSTIFLNLETKGNLTISTKDYWYTNDSTIIIRIYGDQEKGEYAKYGLLNWRGNYIHPNLYTKIQPYPKEKVASIKIGGEGEFRPPPEDELWKYLTFPYTYIGNTRNTNYTRLPERAKWGIIDMEGITLLPPRYDSLGSINPPWIRVLKDTHWAFINLEKKIENLEYYDDIERLDYHDQGFLKITQYGKIGLFDTEMKEVFPIIYSDISVFQDTLLALYEEGKHDAKGSNKKKWGIADLKGQIKIPIYFDNIVPFDENNHPSYFKVSKNDLYGLWSVNGKEILPVQFKRITKHKDSLIRVEDSLNHYYLYNFQGKKVIKGNYTDFSHLEGKFYSVKQGEMVGLYHLEQGEIISPQYKKLSIASHVEPCLIAVLDTVPQIKKLLNLRGKSLININYQDFEHLKGKYYLTKVGEYWGLYHLDIGEIISPQYKSLSIYKSPSSRNKPAYSFMQRSTSLDTVIKLEALLHTDPQTKKLLDLSGKSLINLECRDFEQLKGKYYRTKVGEYWGLYHLDIGEIVPPQYKSLSLFVGAKLVGTLDSDPNMKRLLDYDGKPLFDIDFDGIEPLQGEYFAIKVNNVWGEYHLQKGEIIPPQYEHFQYATDNRVLVGSKDKEWKLCDLEGNVFWRDSTSFMSIEDELDDNLLKVAKDNGSYLAYGVMDGDGNEIISLDSDFVDIQEDHGLLKCEIEEELFSWYKFDGTPVFPENLKKIYFDYYPLLIGVDEQEHIGLFHEQGDIILPFEFASIQIMPMQNGEHMWVASRTGERESYEDGRKDDYLDIYGGEWEFFDSDGKELGQNKIPEDVYIDIISTEKYLEDKSYHRFFKDPPSVMFLQELSDTLDLVTGRYRKGVRTKSGLLFLDTLYSNIDFIENKWFLITTYAEKFDERKYGILDLQLDTVVAFSKSLITYENGGFKIDETKTLEIDILPNGKTEVKILEAPKPNKLEEVGISGEGKFERNMRADLQYFRIGNKIGLKAILPNGTERLISADYQSISMNFTDTYTPVKEGNKWGYVRWETQADGSEMGVIHIPARYDAASPFFEQDGMMVARVYIEEFDLEFFINPDGEMLVEYSLKKKSSNGWSVPIFFSF